MGTSAPSIQTLWRPKARWLIDRLIDWLIDKHCTFYSCIYSSLVDWPVKLLSDSLLFCHWSVEEWIEQSMHSLIGWSVGWMIHSVTDPLMSRLNDSVNWYSVYKSIAWFIHLLIGWLYWFLGQLMESIKWFIWLILGLQVDCMIHSFVDRLVGRLNDSYNYCSVYESIARFIHSFIDQLMSRLNDLFTHWSVDESIE